MRKTGRVNGVFVRVNDEIKKDVERRIKLGFNISQFFEEKYIDAFMNKTKIMDRINQLTDELKIYQSALSELENNEKKFRDLTLQAEEVLKLKQIVSKFNNVDSQFKAFVCVSKKEDLSKEEFIKVKNKYL